MIISGRTLEFCPSLRDFVIMLERFGVSCRLKVVLVCVAENSSDILLEIVISQHSLHLFIGSVDYVLHSDVLKRMLSGNLN